MTRRRNSRTVSRRDFLKAVGAGTAMVGMPHILRANSRAMAQSDVHLEFVVWSYSVDTILDNISKFEELNPGVTVGLTDFAWNLYRETIINRFSSNTPTDMLYSGGDWLPEWATAGWLVPLEDHFPQVMDYVPKIAPYAVSDMTFNDKLYGLPYYADTTSFLYNAQILDDNGIMAPPETWEELEEQIGILRENGMDQPFVLEMAQALPTTLENFTAMVFGRGGELLDENLDPVLDDPEGAAFKQLEWLRKGVDEGWIIVLPHETDVVQALNTGQHAYTVLYNYNLAELNNTATSPLAGQFQLAIMPGGSGETYGFAKFYSMTQMAVDRGEEVTDAVWKFFEYFGGETEGEYVIARRWAFENGLGFGQLPLFDDPEVEASFSQWVDFDVYKQQVSNARGRNQGAWYGIWAETVRLQLVRAVTGEISVEEALAACASQASDLKSQFSG